MLVVWFQCIFWTVGTWLMLNTYMRQVSGNTLGPTVTVSFSSMTILGGQMHTCTHTHTPMNLILLVQLGCVFTHLPYSPDFAPVIFTSTHCWKTN
jgi:hypothetical protein